MKAILLAACIGVGLSIARGAEPPPAGPKDAAVVGTVSSRLGNCVAVALAEGVTVQPNEQLLVGRAALLVALAADGEFLEAWGDWRTAGRIRLRVPRGARHWLAWVVEEEPPPGAGDRPAPNIQPGDRVYRAKGAEKGAGPVPGRAPGHSSTPAARDSTATPGR